MEVSLGDQTLAEFFPTVSKKPVPCTAVILEIVLLS